MSNSSDAIQANKCFHDCPAHFKNILAGLNDLRKKEELLDITLIVQNEVFHAHKAVLAACSDYFRAMFTDNMLESRQTEIVLKGMSSKGFHIVLDYAYTSVLCFNPLNVQDVLAAASLLQMNEIVVACSNYLQSQIDIENCIDLATIAELYSLKKLQEKVYKFMSANLREFGASPDFNRMTVQQVEHLLNSDFPVNCSEADVLKILLNWFNHDICSHHKYAIRLLKLVNFREISSNAIDTLLPHPFTLYKEILMQSANQRKLLKNHRLLNSRGMERALLKIGGYGYGGITNDITYSLKSSSLKWCHLTSVPHVQQCDFGSVVYDNELYIVGGCFNQSLQENIHPFGFKYNPCENKWNTLNPMGRDRCRFSLNTLGDRLYAVGGAIEIHGVPDLGYCTASSTDSCEVYEPKYDLWQYIEPLPEVRMQHAGASYETDTTQYLYISGGMEHDTIVNTLFRYDVQTNKWTVCKPMLSPRADHVMLTIGDYLYVCGGWKDDESRMRTHNCAVDRYDIAADEWKTITQVPTPRFHAGIVSVGNTIYVIGGFQSDGMYDKGSAAIEYYHIPSDTWGALDKYPQDIWEHTCATLFIPKRRKDMEVLRINEELV